MNLYTASAQWASRPADQRFTSLADLRDNVHGRRLRSRSIDLDLEHVRVTPTATSVVINSRIAPAEPTHWSLGQLAGTVKAPGAYLRTLTPPLLADCLNFGLQQKLAESPTAKFMTIEPLQDGPNVLQAVTSTTYGRIWDADVVDAVIRIVDRSGGKFHNPPAYKRGGGGTEPSGLFASDRDVFVFLIDGGSYLEAGPRAALHRGFIAWNSEVGNKTFGLMTFLHNGVCGNLIIWGAQDVNTLLIRHSKGAPGRFDREALPALIEYTQASAKPEVDAIKRAQQKALPDPEDDRLKLVAPFGITRPELRAAVRQANEEEGKCATLWDLIQGGTAYARGFDYVDARVDTSKRFSSLLKIVEE